jgi:hypothetical protein
MRLGKDQGSRRFQLMSSPGDLRTETSSSTMSTIGLASDVGNDPNSRPKAPQNPVCPRTGTQVADCSSHSQCSLERLKQSRIAEWLKHALHGTLFEQPRPHRFVPVRGDEDDRNLPPA